MHSITSLPSTHYFIELFKKNKNNFVNLFLIIYIFLFSFFSKMQIEPIYEFDCSKRAKDTIYHAFLFPDFLHIYKGEFKKYSLPIKL